MRSLASAGKMTKGFMLTFRQKILLSYLFIFLIFTAFLFPLSTYLIRKTQENQFERKMQKLITESKEAPDLESLLEWLSRQEKLLFVDIDLYDPETKRFLKQRGVEKNHFFEEEEEIQKALKHKRGLAVRYSPVYEQRMAFYAGLFTFQNTPYVLQIAIPNEANADLAEDFSTVFLVLSITSLFFYGILAWLVLEHLTRPATKILQAIRPFQLGIQDHIPEIDLGRGYAAKDEFFQLANAFNALTKKIEHQIKTLTHERNEKAAILESLGEGVVAVDRSMIVTYINHMAEIFLNVVKEEILGRNFALSNQSSFYDVIHQAQEKKESVLTVIKSEGKPKRFLDALAVPRGDKGAILVIQDKTSLHKVLELGRDFIANASHELKTPITIIRGFAETLHDHPELSREVFQEILEKIVNNCHRMDTLVKNLLTLAAMDEGLPRSRLQECDLLDLTHQAKETVLAIYPSAQIQINPVGEDSFYLLADSDLLLQAIINLLDNAVKYSKPPAHVTVRFQKKEEEMIIQISDEGIGIPAEDLERIFERFYAVDKSHSRSMGGSGLGLSIVERIVEKHHGKIHVESNVGKGTTFTLTFPIQEEESY